VNVNVQQDVVTWHCFSLTLQQVNHTFMYTLTFCCKLCISSMYTCIYTAVSKDAHYYYFNFLLTCPGTMPTGMSREKCLLPLMTQVCLQRRLESMLFLFYYQLKCNKYIKFIISFYISFKLIVSFYVSFKLIILFYISFRQFNYLAR